MDRPTLKLGAPEPFRVLVVDDVFEILDLVGTTIRRSMRNVLVTTENNAARGHDLVSKLPYQLVIVDARLPNAPAILQAAAATNPAGRRVLIAGESDAGASSAANAHDVLRRPLTRAKVEEMLAKVAADLRCRHPRPRSQERLH